MSLCSDFLGLLLGTGEPLMTLKGVDCPVLFLSFLALTLLGLHMQACTSVLSCLGINACGLGLATAMPSPSLSAATRRTHVNFYLSILVISAKWAVPSAYQGLSPNYAKP